MPNLAGYPSPPGNLNQVVATVPGPSNYATVVVVSPPSGGFVVTAQQLGLTSIHWAEGGLSDDGAFGLQAIFDNNPATDVQQIRFLANTVNTGAQVSAVTNLSARTFRVYAFGY